MMARSAVLAALAGAMLLTTGCFSYRPVVGVAPSPGSELRLELTDQGMMDLARYLGPRAITVDGRLVGVESDSALALDVKLVRTASGDLHRWVGEGTVRMPSSAIASISQRTLARKRTMVVSAGIVAAAISLGVYALDLGRAGGNPDGGGGPPPP
jgi:hypothetical protein